MADSTNTLKGTLGGRKVSARAYAAHRGINQMAVSRAIGVRLTKSVVKNADGSYTIDVDAADREWAENTDLTRVPFEKRDPAPAPAPAVDAPEPIESTVSAAARSKHWEAKHRELKFKEAARELVPASEVREEVSAAFANCRTRLLEIPTRAKQALPHLTLVDVAALEAVVREALEALAEKAADE